MFCIKCGKEAEADNFCRTCFLHRNTLFDIESFRTEFCRQCGNYHRGPIEEQIRGKIKTKNSITDCEIKAKRSGGRVVSKIICTGYINPLKTSVKEEKDVIIIIRNIKCENCIKISGGYYEACFQVRGNEADRILKKLLKLLPGTSIVNIEKIKEGINVKVTSKGMAERALAELVNRFDIKKSFKLVGEKKGKKMYRNFYAIR